MSGVLLGSLLVDLFVYLCFINCNFGAWLIAEYAFVLNVLLECLFGNYIWNVLLEVRLVCVFGFFCWENYVWDVLMAFTCVNDVWDCLVGLVFGIWVWICLLVMYVEH